MSEKLFYLFIFPFECIPTVAILKCKGDVLVTVYILSNAYTVYSKMYSGIHCLMNC